MNSDHLHNRLGFGHGLLIFLIWRHFDLLKEVKFGESGIFFRTLGRDSLTFHMLVYPDQIWNWLHFGHGPMVFLMLASCLLSETGHFFKDFFRTQGRNGLQLGMLIYCDHVRSRLYVGHDLLFFLILAPFWNRSNLGFPGFSLGRMEVMAYYLTCCCTLTTFGIDCILVTVCWF